MTPVILNDGESVFNIPGTGPCTTSDGSWKQYWLNRSGRQWPQNCCIKQCTNSATDGAHVKISNNPGDYKNYILPMCHRCNTGRLDQGLPVNANSKAVLVEPGNC